jgi:hypothetical protein
MAKAKATKTAKVGAKRKGVPSAGKAPAGGIFADVLTSAQMGEHRRRDGILLLPLGCFEMHGMQANMSCDSFLVEAACRIVAPEWGAVIMPTIHYCYPGASAHWPGTVNVSPRDTLDYVIAVMAAILENGFRRLVLVSLHGPNNAMLSLALREVFDATGELPIAWAPDYGEFCRRVEQEFGEPHGEAAMLLASMYVCGRHGEFNPAATEAERLEGPKYPMPSAWTLRSHGVNLPYLFTQPNNHVGRYPGMTLDDAPRLAEIYREVIMEKARDLPKDYGRFQKEMWAAIDKAPWDKL